MTLLYIRKPQPVLAWQYEDQPQDQWPQWVRDYRVYGGMGEVPIGRSGVGTVLVPTRGTSIVVQKGDWLVADGFVENTDGTYDMKKSVIGVHHAGEFAEQFEIACA